MLRQLSYAIKNQLKVPKAPTRGFLAFRWFFMHGATYPYAIKNQQKARKSLVGGFGCLELVLYCIRELA